MADTICCFACAEKRPVHPLSSRGNICVDCYKAPVVNIAEARSLERNGIASLRRDLEAAGLGPMLDSHHGWGADDSKPLAGAKRQYPWRLDPWDAVIDALDAGIDPIAAQDGVYAEAEQDGLYVVGSRRSESQREAKREHEKTRPVRTRPSRAAYMREYRRRKKAA